MTRKDPHFLISIPTFNRSDLLEPIVLSAMNQNYRNWDILFMDDGSSDDTPNVVQKLKEKFPKVHYGRMSQNSGVNATRNQIIETALKDFPESFLYFLDDDDLLYEQCLQDAADLINENPGYNWYSLDCVFPDGSPISRMKKYGELNYIRDYMFSKTMRGDLTNIVRVQGVGDARFTTRFRNAEIWFFWTSLSLKNALFAGNKIGSVKEYLPGGITKSGFNRDKAIEVARYKIEVLEPVVGRKAMRHQYVTLAKHLLDKGQKEEARQVLVTIFKASPLYFRPLKHWLRLLRR